MNKILKVDGEVVQIGIDNGGLREVKKSEFNYEPQIGDEVEIFENETGRVIVKVEKKQENKGDSINININNTVEKKVVNKITYAILAGLFGGIGVHKFYAGKIGLGLVYLLFCWTGIPAIIAFIEFIIALCTEADVNGNIAV